LCVWTSVLFGEGRTISEAANTSTVSAVLRPTTNSTSTHPEDYRNVPDWFNSDDDDDANGGRQRPRYQRHANVDTPKTDEDEDDSSDVDFIDEGKP
jgi:hypothetical protein